MLALALLKKAKDHKANKPQDQSQYQGQEAAQYQSQSQPQYQPQQQYQTPYPSAPYPTYQPTTNTAAAAAAASTVTPPAQFASQIYQPQRVQWEPTPPRRCDACGGCGYTRSSGEMSRSYHSGSENQELVSPITAAPRDTERDLYHLRDVRYHETSGGDIYL